MLNLDAAPGFLQIACPWAQERLQCTGNRAAELGIRRFPCCKQGRLHSQPLRASASAMATEEGLHRSGYGIEVFGPPPGPETQEEMIQAAKEAEQLQQQLREEADGRCPLTTQQIDEHLPSFDTAGLRGAGVVDSGENGEQQESEASAKSRRPRRFLLLCRRDSRRHSLCRSSKSW